MHPLRCILAALFAILIANPACLCAAMTPAEQPAGHSCCGKQKEKQEAACDCAAHAPRISEAKASLPDAPAFLLPSAILSTPPMPEAGNAPPSTAKVSPRADTGPPRLRLALWQRFLI